MSQHDAPALALSDVREGEVYTPREVAALFKVDRRTVAGWCRRGAMVAGRTLGGDYRVLGAEVLRVWGMMFQAAASTSPRVRDRRPEADADAQVERIRTAKKGRPKGR